MRKSVLFAIVLVAGGAFVATRGAGWHYGYLIPGGVTCVLGAILMALLVTPRKAPPVMVDDRFSPRRLFFLRSNHRRLQRAFSKAAARAEVS